jgi:ribosomal protein L37E
METKRIVVSYDEVSRTGITIEKIKNGVRIIKLGRFSYSMDKCRCELCGYYKIKKNKYGFCENCDKKIINMIVSNIKDDNRD